MKCKGCGLEKDPSLFYESNQSRCKECVKESARSNRKEKIEYYREYDRNRPNMAKRIEQQVERSRSLYHSDAEFRDAIRKTKKDWADRNKQKRQAQGKVSNSLRDGKITKPDSCEHCDTSDKAIQAHHWSYEPEHWLDVIWLCTTCHGKEHRRLNELGRDPDNTPEG